ncbi:MAG: methylenetetrahydrofolate reductase C-terminal domain-containing protein, partial [Candidatus Ratteibacteria bacterium]
MLITKVKKENFFDAFSGKRLFIFKCFGCKEVFFPEEEVDKIIKKFANNIIKIERVDYLCREECSKIYIEKNKKDIDFSEMVIVFSCGIGVSLISKLVEEKIVIPGCNTFYLNGFQGLSVLNFNCNQCGECRLNYTGGICPVTSCAKGLLNGPCGGAKDGKCEVSKEMDCGWIKIFENLKKQKREILKEI